MCGRLVSWLTSCCLDASPLTIGHTLRHQLCHWWVLCLVAAEFRAAELPVPARAVRFGCTNCVLLLWWHHSSSTQSFSQMATSQMWEYLAHCSSVCILAHHSSGSILARHSYCNQSDGLPHVGFKSSTGQLPLQSFSGCWRCNLVYWPSVRACLPAGLPCSWLAPALHCLPALPACAALPPPGPRCGAAS